MLLEPVSRSDRTLADQSGNRSVIAALIGAAFVMVLNETIMATALPHLMRDFDVTASMAQWLTTGFILAMAIVAPTTGYVMQRFSTRITYLGSVGTFSVGTTLALCAPGFYFLLFARLVQALGTAVMLPLLSTTVMQLVEPEKRGSYIGSIVVVMATAPAFGPPLSGLIISGLGWRGIFLCVLPVALIALTFGMARLRSLSFQSDVRLDAVSVPLAAGAFGGLIYGISQIGAGKSVGELLPILAASVTCLILFIHRQTRVQRQGRNPLLDLTAFANRQFATGMILICVVVLCQAGAMAILPLYTQNLLGFSISLSGLLLMPGGLIIAALAIPIGRLFDRVGLKPLMIPGTIIICCAMGAFSFVIDRSPSAMLLGTIYAVLNAGIGITMTPVFTTALAALAPMNYAHGSSIISTLQPLFAALAVALFIGIMSRLSANPGVIDVASTRIAFIVGTVISLFGVVVGLTYRHSD